MNGLYLHCGADKATRDEVFEVVTPEPEYRGKKAKRLYYPTGHDTVLRAVETSLGRNGYEVKEEAHALTAYGQRYFGLLSVGSLSGRIGSDHDTVIGLRNSHDCSFPISLALGARVFVCDNLAFAGEVQVTRKHSRWAGEDMPGLIDSAIGQLVSLHNTQEARYASYRGLWISPETAHSLVVRARQAEIIGDRMLLEIVREYENPSHPELAGHTLWNLYNAFTENFKPRVKVKLEQVEQLDIPAPAMAPAIPVMELAGTRLDRLPEQTKRLHGLFDLYVESRRN